MPSPSPLSRLPEELLLLIFHHLDSPAPSELNNRREPSLLLTTDTRAHIYKDIALVSRGWRRIVLPLLFRYSRVRLDIEPRDEWSDRAVHNKGLHVDKHAGHDVTSGCAQEPGSTAVNPAVRAESSLQWASRFHNCLQDYLEFVQGNNLASSIQSFVVLTGPMSLSDRARLPPQAARGGDHRYQAAADFWSRLYSVVQPARVVVVAPPGDMACLANAVIDTASDWAFVDMDFHILELSVAGSVMLSPTHHQVTPKDVMPTKSPGIADASILKLHPWTHIAINEGSFVKAYGTYEYFEHGPPSLIYSIKDCLTSSRGMSKGGGVASGTSLRSFSYTAILPFANHVDFGGFLEVIDEFDIKLAPDPDFDLNDKARIGRAELEDCWQEFFSAYRSLVETLRTFRILAQGSPKLQRFVCRDMHIPALQPDLAFGFTMLCLPIWIEPEPGIFVRQDSPPMYKLEGW